MLVNRLIGFFSPVRASVALFLLLASLSVQTACSAVGIGLESAYVVSRRMELRNSTAKVFRAVGELKNGDKVTILERLDDDGRSWARLRGPEGQTGWADSRFLVTEEMVNSLQEMAVKTKDIPAQAVGRSKAYLKLRLTPDRSNDDNVVTRLQSGTIFEILEHERKPRPSTPATAAASAAADDDADADTEDSEDQKMDEWLKVRVRDNKILPAGWVYGGSVQLDIPDEISPYPSGGYEIIGWQQIGSVTDSGGRSGGVFLVLERELFPDDKNKGGNEDFQRLKVISWDPGKRDYFTAQRFDINGKFPLLIKMDGNHGQFQMKELEKSGSEVSRDCTVDLQSDGRVTITGLKAEKGRK